MAELKSGWKSSETQVGVGGAITALIVTALVAYFGVTTEQAVTIAGGLVTAGVLLYKTIESRRSVKTTAIVADAQKAVAATTAAAPSAPPLPPHLSVTPPGRTPYIPPAPPPPQKQWLEVPPSMLLTDPKPDPYGREGDVDGP